MKLLRTIVGTPFLILGILLALIGAFLLIEEY